MLRDPLPSDSCHVGGNIRVRSYPSCCFLAGLPKVSYQLTASCSLNGAIGFCRGFHSGRGCVGLRYSLPVDPGPN